MPYLAHFGLKDHPFTLTPNLDYYYPTQENTNIIASLEFALRRESGIVKIVGEVGTGKTLLCRLLINKLIETDAVAYINAPQADAKSIIMAVCDEFGLTIEGDASPYAALNRFLLGEHEKGRLAVVVVDEAQHLGRDGLEAIRLVSNLETQKSKLLQIVLFGQTELDDLLSDPALRQLNQRVVFSFSTKPLTEAEARRYVAHRIKVSRRQGVDYTIFSDDALTVIARRSGGIPRVVNIIADKSLLVAFSEGSPTVQRKHALEAIRDTPGLVARGGFDWSWLSAVRDLFGRRAAVISLLAVLAAGLGGWFAWSAVHRTSPASPDVVAATPPAGPHPAPAPVAAAPAAIAPAAAVSVAPPSAAPPPTQAPAAVAAEAPPVRAPAASPPAVAASKVAHAKPRVKHLGSLQHKAPSPATAHAAEPPSPAAAPAVVPVSGPSPVAAAPQAPAAQTTAVQTTEATATTSAAAPADIPVSNDASFNATLPGRPGIYSSGRSH